MAPDRGQLGDEVAMNELNMNDRVDCVVKDVAENKSTINSQSHSDSQTVPPHLSHDPQNNARVSDPFQFGQRLLSQSDDVFEYNAWDHVEPDAEYEAYSQSQYEKQRSAPVSDFDKNRFNNAPEKWWDLFYKQKTSTFFKDRKWLGQEFPILKEVTRADAGEKVVLEVGAGAGNTAFPIMRWNENPSLKLWAVDFSKTAVKVMREAADYGETIAVPESESERKPKIGAMRAEVWDIAGSELPEGLTAGSVDVVILIFIFSALNPEQWRQAVRNVHSLLKPGGQVLFRDYGRGDLAQVRFKSGRYMEENFYVRGDGTRVYFSEKEELQQVWSGTYWDSPHEDKHNEIDAERFEVANLDIDRRLIVNRQRRIKMYRCWIQGRFVKPEIS